MTLIFGNIFNDLNTDTNDDCSFSDTTLIVVVVDVDDDDGDVDVDDVDDDNEHEIMMKTYGGDDDDGLNKVMSVGAKT